MKTPEQIARETLGADALAGIGYEQYIPYMVAAIEADRAQRERAVVVVREGVAYGDYDQIDIIDLDFLDAWPDAHSDYDQDGIDWMVATLERAGLHSAADEVREWWAER